jgi:plastocyanin
VEPDGVFQAWDARTGDILWRFQTGQIGLPGGAGPGGGSAAVYQAGGEQFVALTMNRLVWAFKLGGTVPPRDAPPAPPTSIPWSGTVEQTAAVTLGTSTTYTIASASRRVVWDNDYALSPARIRVAAGTTVTWTNASKRTHTLAARDGSWTTKVIAPGGSGSATVARPGTYEYICTEHPWSIGQMVVE